MKRQSRPMMAVPITHNKPMATMPIVEISERMSCYEMCSILLQEHLLFTIEASVIGECQHFSIGTYTSPQLTGWIKCQTDSSQFSTIHYKKICIILNVQKNTQAA